MYVKSHMETQTLICNKAWEIEDYLQSFETSTGRPVFCSAFNDKKIAHSDSYLTCTNFKEFLEAYDNAIEKKLFTKEDWLDTCEYWFTTSSGQPLKVIGIFIKEDLTRTKSVVFDICPSRDDAQKHIFDNDGKCKFCYAKL